MPLSVLKKKPGTTARCQQCARRVPVEQLMMWTWMCELRRWRCRRKPVDEADGRHWHGLRLCEDCRQMKLRF